MSVAAERRNGIEAIDRVEKAFRRTGCLVSADGTGDHEIKPEGLDDRFFYDIKTPSECRDSAEEASKIMSERFIVEVGTESDSDSDSESDDDVDGEGQIFTIEEATEPMLHFGATGEQESDSESSEDDDGDSDIRSTNLTMKNSRPEGSPIDGKEVMEVESTASLVDVESEPPKPKQINMKNIGIGKYVIMKQNGAWYLGCVIDKVDGKVVVQYMNSYKGGSPEQRDFVLCFIDEKDG